MYLKKTDSATGKTIEGAMYILYTDETCKNMAKDVNGKYAVLTSTSSGSNTLTMNAGTYYAKEVSAPSGYLTDTAVHSVTLGSEETKELNFKDTPASTGGKKSSASTDLTNGNSCYSLAGAEYTVYCKDCGAKVGVTTTDADGNFSKLTHQHYVIDHVPDPVYNQETDSMVLQDPVYAWKNVAYNAYAVETKAAKGYALCADKHEFIVNTDGTLGFDCSEVPLDDPFSLKLTKYMEDGVTGEYTPVSTGGALFQVQYFMNTDGNTVGDAAKTWVFETDNTGYLACDVESYLVADKSDALYKNSDGGIIYPLGTYLIKEIQPPKYFQLDGTMNLIGSSNKVNVKDGLIVKIIDNNGKAQIIGGNGSGAVAAENLTLNAFDKLYKGSVNVTKYDDDGKTPLEGVSFKLTGADGSEYNATTDKDGHIEFGELLPQKYTLTETKTVEGHTLLKDNIDVTIPLEMTKDEAKAQNADTNKAVWSEVDQIYCFYDVSFEVTNSSSMEVPMTGGNQVLLYVGMIMAFVMIGVGIFFIIKKKQCY